MPGSCAEHLEFSVAPSAERYRRHCSADSRHHRAARYVVPVCGSFLHYPFRSRRLADAAMYDYDLLASVLLDFHAAHLPDAISVEPLMPGPVFDILDCRQWQWPGHGLSDDAAFQWVEGEYMRDDEYELLIADPTLFWLTRYLPRVFPPLAPLAAFGG